MNEISASWDRTQQYNSVCLIVLGIGYKSTEKVQRNRKNVNAIRCKSMQHFLLVHRNQIHHFCQIIRKSIRLAPLKTNFWWERIFKEPEVVVNLNFFSLKLEATTITRFILISPLPTLNSHRLPVLLCDSDMPVVIVVVVVVVVVAAAVVVSFTELKFCVNDCWACCVSYEIDKSSRNFPELQLSQVIIMRPNPNNLRARLM